MVWRRLQAYLASSQHQGNIFTLATSAIDVIELHLQLIYNVKLQFAKVYYFF